MVFCDRLPNGIRVVGENMPSYRSVSMGVWINAGSVYECAQESGAAHFIEHMLFKGTQNRSASQIAEEMDAVGGNLNAFTSKECTCFYGRVLNQHTSVLADMLADLLCNSRLAETDIELEKGVVCEEINMVEDSPEDLVGELACAAFYEEDPLSLPILGTGQSVHAFTRAGLVRYMERLYRPDNMVIAVAGSFDREELMATLANSFNNTGTATGAAVSYGNHAPGQRFRFADKDIEQTHICLNLNGFKTNAPEGYDLLVLNNALGGSMSSRLFQKIRENKGLAYSVYSYPTAYKESGYFTLYAGTGVENGETVLGMMLDEIRQLQRDGISEAELVRAKNQLVAGFMLGQESTSARASSIGRAELINRKHYTEDEIIAKISAVTCDSIMEILPHVCNLQDASLAVVGRCGDSEARFIQILKNA